MATARGIVGLVVAMVGGCAESDARRCDRDADCEAGEICALSTCTVGSRFPGLDHLGDADCTGCVGDCDGCNGLPGRVGDLEVIGMGRDRVLIRFTEVSDGLGEPADYDVRFHLRPIRWGYATSAFTGTCSVPVKGLKIGVQRVCEVAGLAVDTEYDLQLVSLRGLMNEGATFGPLSNVAAGRTTP